MKNNSINIALQNFISDINSKSILIDGPWGCGKTYQIKEFIKKNKKHKIYYLSLFGLESIDEINTALYHQTRKFHRIINYGTNLISKVIKVVPQIRDITVALEFQLGICKNNKVKKKTIIVLDDIERLSDKIQYSDLMGYFNSLYLSGCRLICVMSSENVHENRKKYLDEFKEKVFDCIYRMINFDENIIKQLFDNYNITNFSEVNELFESNLRLVQKTKNFYEKVINRIKKNNKHIDFNEQLLLKACIYVVNICFKTHEYEPNENDYLFDNYCERFGNYISKNIYYYKRNEKYQKDYIIPNFSRIVESLIPAFYYQDFTNFDEIYFISDLNTDNDILNCEFYFLSDDNKIKFVNKLKDLLLTRKLDWNDKNIYKLKNILLFLDFEIETKIIDEIALLINNQMDFCIDITSREVRIELQLENEKSNEKTEKFINQLEQTLKKIRNDNLINKFNNLLKTNSYYELSKFLDIVGYCQTDEKKEFLDYIFLNNFFIPDISGDINSGIWTYCHSIARFAKKNEKGNDFIKVLINTHKGKKTRSELDRCYVLIQQNINKNIDVETLK